MTEELTKKENSFLAPLLIGGVIGAGLALLLAPKPGKEVREDIKRLAMAARDSVSKTIDQGKILYEGGRTAVTSAIDAGKAVYLQEKEKFQKAS